MEISRQMSNQMVRTIRSNNESMGSILLSVFEENSMKKITVEDVANLFCMSSRTLNRRLNQEGTSYRELYALARDNRAKMLLTESSYPIAIISSKLGYTDPSNFTKAFKKLNYVTPKQFRLESLSRIE